jgi:hypothetical protein
MAGGGAVKYFRRTANGMPNFGQGAGGWPVGAFKTKKRVPVSRLVSTNRSAYLDESRVERYMRRFFKDPVYVVEKDGWYYIADGHHTAAAEIKRGRSYVDARVYKIEGC